MSDKWEYFPCQMGDDRAFIFVDVGIRDEIETLPPHLLRLRIAFQQPTENGLPGDDEFDALREFEDGVVDWLSGYDSQYIGRITVNGHRHFFIATPEADKEEWGDRMESLPNGPDYKLALLTEADGVPEAYWDELYPGPEDWQVIKDLRVIEAVRKNGDDGSLPREIDHWAIFSTQSAADEFSDWAQTQGYQFKESRLTENGNYSVYLTHHGTLDLSDITTHTITLMRQAEACGGDYDGWGTAIQKKQQG